MAESRIEIGIKNPPRLINYRKLQDDLEEGIRLIQHHSNLEVEGRKLYWKIKCLRCMEFIVIFLFSLLMLAILLIFCLISIKYVLLPLKMLWHSLGGYVVAALIGDTFFTVGSILIILPYLKIHFLIINKTDSYINKIKLEHYLSNQRYLIHLNDVLNNVTNFLNVIPISDAAAHQPPLF